MGREYTWDPVHSSREKGKGSPRFISSVRVIIPFQDLVILNPTANLLAKSKSLSTRNNGKRKLHFQ